MKLHAKISHFFKKGWICCCILATLGTTAWQLWNYRYGPDQTVVTFKKFNEMETDLYPSLGLCWTMIINEESLKRCGSNFSAMDYVNFLGGWPKWDEKMLTVDYDDVTLHLDDYVQSYGYRTSSNKNVLLYVKDESVKKRTPIIGRTLSWE